MSVSPGIVLLLAISLAACEASGQLLPAPEARLEDDTRSAASESAGVRVTAAVGAWAGDPPNLSEAVVPLRVSIANGSERSLRVRHSELELAGPALDHAPLPAFELVDRQLTVRDEDPVLVPRFTHSGFYVAPYYPASFVGLTPWYGPWEVDRTFYVRQYPKWRVSLPTVDMIEAALPEGVVEPGGSIRGFVFYDRPDPGVRRVALELDLIDARTELAFGEIRIPFIVR